MSLFIVSIVAAQSGGGYDLTWNTIDGGRRLSQSAATNSLIGTIGQADAGASSGGTYVLSGGFLGSGLSVLTAQFKIYLPLVLK